MNGRMLIAWNLRKIRVQQGISQEALAADAGIDRAYLGGLERQVSIGDLLRQPDEDEAPPVALKRGRKKGS